MSKAEALPLGAASPVKVSSRTLPNLEALHQGSAALANNIE